MRVLRVEERLEGGKKLDMLVIVLLTSDVQGCFGY